ncbi:lycopene cyclase domain-containing protein [Corynebacterium urogenitale]
MTYVLISLPFLLAAASGALWSVLREKSRHGVDSARRQLKVIALVTAVVLVLTAVFDNLMIWAGLVGYGDGERLGWQLGLVPVEDFFYAIFVTLLVPALWKGHK